MKNGIKEIALLLTQFEEYGAIGKNEFIKYFIAEELELDESNISDYNDYLSENGYETYFEDLDDVLTGQAPSEIARMCFYGNFNFSYDFHQLNGYGNIDSFEAWQIVKEMKEDRAFLEWYIETYDLIDWDSEEVEQAIIEANKLILLGY